jgi:putative copper export protein/methionine-rich copper-binding protein CopC
MWPCGGKHLEIMTFSRLFGILVLALALLPAQARAHLKLASSSPAQGDTVRQPVSQLTLTFTDEVDESFLTISILDAFGRELGVAMNVHPIGASPSKQYMVMLDTPLAGGAFTVRWKSVGADGHAVTGMFDFLILASSPSPSSAPAPSAGVHPPEHGGHHTQSTEIPPLFRPESSWLWMFARWVNFSALILMVGAVAFRFGVLERAVRHLGEPLTTNVDDVLRRFALVAAVFVILSNILRLWLQFGSIHGPERLFEGDLLGALLLKGGWGKAWIAQTVAAAGYLVSVAIKTEDRSDSWYSAIPFAVVAASAPAFSGHAAAVQQMAIVPILDDAVHVMAASAWLGTLAVLMFAALPRVLRAEDGFVKLAAMVNIFSPLALVMAGIAVFTGAMNAFIHITAFSDLWTTPYGRLLALKIGLVLLTMTMGAYNWRVVKPALGTEAAARDLKRSARSEVAMGAIIIVITAILVATPTGL